MDMSRDTDATGAPEAGLNPASGGLLAELRGSGQPEGAEGGKPASKIPPQFRLLIPALAASAALLYGMRFMGTRGGMAMADVDLTYQRDETVAGGAKDAVMKQLAENEIPPQIGAEFIDKNPFLLGSLQTESIVEVEPKTEDEAAILARRMLEEQQRKQAERAEAIKRELEGIRLQGVMQGRVPLARVNGQVAKIGDMLGEHLKVVEIHGRSIVVEADGERYTVDMPESGGN